MLRPIAPTLPLHAHVPAVLLFRGRGFLSWAIRWQTRGAYSHAAILMPDGRIIESYPGVGVRVRPLGGIDWDGADAFDVPRLTGSEWDRAIAFALSERGCKYDWWGVIRFISRRHLPENEKWFCSELVFESLQKAGLDLLKRIPADEVSPQMLSLSPMLEPREQRSRVIGQEEDELPVSGFAQWLASLQEFFRAARAGGIGSWLLSVLRGCGRGSHAPMPPTCAALAVLACAWLLPSCAEPLPVKVGVCKGDVCATVQTTIPAHPRPSGKEARSVQ